jgi:hypothetical protein
MEFSSEMGRQAEGRQKKAGVVTGLVMRYDDSLLLVQMAVLRRSDRHPFAPLAVFGFAEAADFLDDFLDRFFLYHFFLGHCQISSMKDECYVMKVPLSVYHVNIKFYHLS